MNLGHINNSKDLLLIVAVTETKNNIRMFIVTNIRVDELNLITIYNKYVSFIHIWSPFITRIINE